MLHGDSKNVANIATYNKVNPWTRYTAYTLWKKLRYFLRIHRRLVWQLVRRRRSSGRDTGALPPWSRRPDCSVPSDRPATVRPVIQNIRRHSGHAVSDDHHQFVETNSLQRRSRIRRLDRPTVVMPAVSPIVRLQWKNEFHCWNHDSSVELFHDGTCSNTNHRTHF